MARMIVPLDLLIPYLVASVLVTVIPGADMALVTRQVLVGGPALAQKTIFGNLAGLLVHGVALTAGLSALLVASATAYTVVKLAGAAFLVYLGVQALLSSRRPPLDGPPAPAAAPRRAFLQGLVSTVLNPKPALFFLTFLPQFVDPARGSVATQILVLGAILGTLGFAADCWYALAASSAARRLGGWRHGRTLTGVVYLALGTTAAAFGGRAH